MQDLTEKVQTIEKRLDELGKVLDIIRSAIDSGEQHHSGPATRNGRAGRPSWVDEIFKRFEDILAALRSVNKALSTAKSNGGGQATAKDARAALVYEAPSQGRPKTEQMS